MSKEQLHQLLTELDVPTPRYTSYPTVPFWDINNPDIETITPHIKQALSSNNNELSLYIHLPYCEDLCTYCGCNKRITKNHEVEIPYLNTVLKEWKMYLSLLDTKPTLRELHLGGGTPTFFSAENLDYLLSNLLESVNIHPHVEMSLEAHPNHTNKEQLETLYNHGFRRLSIGVQDLSPKIQFVINRIQPFEVTKNVVELAREIGFEAINIDIIYGLPLQTIEDVNYTIDKVNELKPERIAFYSYAHVPWKSKGQRRYKDEDVPFGASKRALYETGREELIANGYKEIGMDHFALPTDELFKAEEQGTLNRNFMGYTTTLRKSMLLGLGASSISDSWSAYFQNEKEIEKYMEMVNNNQFPLIKGHILNNQDLHQREQILNLMCNHKTEIKENTVVNNNILSDLVKKQLIDIQENNIIVKDFGKIFIRNVSTAFDEYFEVNNQKQFSKSV